VVAKVAAATAAREATTSVVAKEAAIATTAKEAMMAATAKEAVTAVAAKEAVLAMVTKEATIAVVTNEVPGATLDQNAAAEKTATTAELSDTGGDKPGAAQANATPDLKAAAKRPTTMMGSGGSSPPCKRFSGT
jgi:hypothetical protein